MKLKHHMEGGGVSWFRFHMGCYANEGLYCLSMPPPPLPPYVDSRGLSLPRKEVVKSGSYSKLNHEKIPLFFQEDDGGNDNDADGASQVLNYGWMEEGD